MYGSVREVEADDMKLEDLIALSRPEALDMLRQIEEMVNFEPSSGCVFADIDACGEDCCKVTTSKVIPS